MFDDGVFTTKTAPDHIVDAVARDPGCGTRLEQVRHMVPGTSVERPLLRKASHKVIWSERWP